MAEHVKPGCVTPLTVYLCSEQCEVTHSIYSVGGGRFARIFIGMGQGWLKGVGVEASAEDMRVKVPVFWANGPSALPVTLVRR